MCVPFLLFCYTYYFFVNPIGEIVVDNCYIEGLVQGHFNMLPGVTRHRTNDHAVHG